MRHYAYDPGCTLNELLAESSAIQETALSCTQLKNDLRRAKVYCAKLHKCSEFLRGAPIDEDMLKQLPEELQEVAVTVPRPRIARSIARRQEIMYNAICDQREIIEEIEKNLESHDQVYGDLIRDAKLQLMHMHNPLCLMDLPTEVLAEIAQHMPWPCRQICRLFREFIPVTELYITRHNMRRIAAATWPRSHLPLYVQVDIYDNGTADIIAAAAARRPLHLVTNMPILGNSLIYPEILHTQGRLHPSNICMDRLRRFTFTSAHDLRNLADKFRPDMPLRKLKLIGVSGILPGGAPVLLDSGPLRMNLDTYMAMITHNIYFTGAVTLGYVSVGQYRKLRKAAEAGYLLSHMRLTGRARPLLVLNREYKNTFHCGPESPAP